MNNTAVVIVSNRRCPVDGNQLNELADHIFKTICKYFSKTEQEAVELAELIKGKAKPRFLQDKRSACMYFMKEYTKMSYPSLRGRFNRGCHTAVMDGYVAYSNLISTDKRFQYEKVAIEMEIQKSLPSHLKNIFEFLNN
jgi:chromosomal replication initiation ATPase DnaA